jgi:hypothetical protein
VKNGEVALSMARRDLSPFLRHTVTGWSKIAWNGTIHRHGEYAHGDRVFTVGWTKRPPGSDTSSSSSSTSALTSTGQQLIGLELKSGPWCYMRYDVAVVKTPSAEGTAGAVRWRWSITTPADLNKKWFAGTSSCATLDLEMLSDVGAYALADDSIEFIIHFTPLDAPPPVIITREGGGDRECVVQ